MQEIKNYEGAAMGEKKGGRGFREAELNRETSRDLRTVQK